MTAEPAICPATFLPNDTSCRRPDPVRARVSVEPQLVASQSLYRESANWSQADLTETMRLPPDTRGGRRKPHPGDVLYWVACLGGACLLLIKATT
jgi:hypothetical protein